MTETVSETSITTAPMWPTFTYRDAPAAIEFLRKAFGFVETARYGDGDVVEHAELRWPGGGGIMLGSEREGMASCSPSPGAGSVYIVIDNPDEVYERAKAAGAAITTELREEDYGSRGFSCRDPEGVYWSFGTYAGA
ncbi:VOC family protein [Nocardia mexicana]|uniref:Putative glyoxalase superfamily protein PhnB n=1 Tax=Nocardia mexicana TaxID=279262 RepID=A0A370H9L7_9NOCA|nr:VOC family protein [Nocardia mexicana]RDI53106.1 putative glyoxalase superfamily protein PhnB [Nocardia mexicana]